MQSTSESKDNQGLRTLLGTYFESGSNHGRKTYQKIQKTAGQENYEVHLYYWDGRDGSDFAGWWFGSEVGGTEVWARNESHSHTPPLDKWRVPWDGPVGDMIKLQMRPEKGEGKNSAESSGASSRAPPADANGRPDSGSRSAVKGGSKREEGSNRVHTAKEIVTELEATVTRVIEDARQMCAEPAADDALQEAERTIMDHQKRVDKAQRKLHQELSDAKAANEDQPTLSALSKMGTRLRALQTSLTSELGHTKAIRGDMQAKEKRRAEESEHLRQAEEQDAQALQQLLPEAMDQVTQVEDAIETVEILAAPLNNADDDDDTAGDSLRLVEEVDQAASKAQRSFTDVKRQIDEFIGKAKRFSPEARKTAGREFKNLKERLDALQARLSPLKKFKQDFMERHAAKKALEEVASMLGSAELEVEKARIMGASGVDEQMSKQDIKSAEESLGPAKSGIDKAIQHIERNLKQSTSSFLKRELTKARDRAEKARVMLEDTASKIQAHKDGLAAMQIVEQAHKKVDKAEYSMHDCSEAEMPFLKGIEVLPHLEAMEAVKASDEAAAKAESLIKEAKKFLNSQDTKRFSKEIQKKSSDEMAGLQNRLSEVEKKLRQFVKDTAQRKAQALLSEVAEKVAEAAGQVQMLGEVTKLLTSDKLEDASIDTLQATCDQSAAAEKEAATLMKEAQHLINSKKKEFSVAQQRDGAEGTELAKLTKRMSNAEKELSGFRKIASYGAALIKAKMNVEKAAEMTKQAEASLERVDAAENPFTKGLELPYEEAKTLFAECKEAAKNSDELIKTARTFIAAKFIEAKNMPDEVGKGPQQEYTKMQETLAGVHSKLKRFQGDTEERRKTALMEDAKSKLDKLEKEVEKAAEAAKPLAEEDPEKIEAKVAAQICEKLAVLDKTAQKNMEETRNFLRDRQPDVKGHATFEKLLETLTGRLGALQTQLTKAKRAASEHEQRFVAKKLVREATGLVNDVEAEVERTKGQTAPLLVEHGQKLLVAERMLGIVDALGEHLEKSSKTVDELFGEISGKVKDGKDVADNDAKAAFCQYLDKLPAKLGRDDLTYSDFQREQMYAYVVGESDGELTLAGFKNLFCAKFSCVHAVAVTDIFEISKSKTVTKLEVDQVVEGVGRPRLSEKLGVERIEVKLENGTTGWVTMKGNHGTSFLAPFSPYASFVLSMDRLFDAVSKSTAKAVSFIKTKSNELASCSQGPLAHAKTDLDKLRPKAAAAQRTLEDLKQKVYNAKRDYVKSQEAEKRSQQEARDRKVADGVLDVLKGKVDLMDAGAKKLADAAKITTMADSALLESFPTPLTVQKASQELAVENAKECAAVRECVKEHKDIGAKASRGPLFDLNKALEKAGEKAKATEEKNAMTLEYLKKACKTIAVGQAEKVVVALREELQKRSITIEALFLELADGQEQISEEAFCKHVNSLGLNLPEEHGKLVVNHIDSGAISRRGLKKLVQQYYTCVKSIMITEDFNISKSKTVRHLQVGEIVEVVEGPKKLEKSGINRVKAKALKDEAVGWISVKGNQGSSFLEETRKPYYSCSTEARLEKTFESKDGPENLVRMLRPQEVLEVVSGPRTEEISSFASRSKAKALSDGATGYITVKTRDGVVTAEKGTFFICSSSIAITDGRNIRTCKVLRKLAVGEVFIVLEGPFTEEASSMTRARMRSTKDGQEGWVTTKGNAGTVYASESTRHYTMLRATPLQTSFKSLGAVDIRELAEGEAVEILESPKDEKPEEVARLQGRSLSDDAVGWVTVSCGADHYLKPSSLLFKCVFAADMHSAASSVESPLVRRLEQAETLEMIDGPTQDSAGLLRIRARAEKDGAVGYVTLKDSKGTGYLAAVKPK